MEPDASTDFQQLISEIFEQQPNDGLKGVLRCFLLDDKFQMVYDYKSKLESGGSYCAFKKTNHFGYVQNDFGQELRNP